MLVNIKRIYFICEVNYINRVERYIKKKREEKGVGIFYYRDYKNIKLLNF